MNYSYNNSAELGSNCTNYKYSSNQNMATPVFCVEPYVVSALTTLISKRIVVETVRGSLTGMLMDVKPDHIVIGEMYGNSKFFIRIAEIVHIMPIDDDC